MLKYTICFIKKGNEILLINREKPSWMGSWNGVGGKIAVSETPEQCVIREVFEETGIELESVKYKGVVTWTENGIFTGGMYAFTADVPENFKYNTPAKTDEGILDWKSIQWILDPQNTGVAHNLPGFLPKMLDDDGIYEHLCVFEDDVLVGIQTNAVNSY